MSPRSAAHRPAPSPSPSSRLGPVAGLLILLAPGPATSQAVNDFRLPAGRGQPAPVPAGPPAGDLPPRTPPEPQPTPSPAPAVRPLPATPGPPDGEPQAAQAEGERPMAPPSARRSAPTTPPFKVQRPPRTAPRSPPLPASPPPSPAPANPAALVATPVAAPMAPTAPRVAHSPDRWPWLLGGGAAGLVAGLLLAGLVLRRQRGATREPPAAAPRPSPGEIGSATPDEALAEAPATAPAPPPPMSQLVSQPVPQLVPEVGFEPLRLTLSLRYATLHYRLTLGEPGATARRHIVAGLDMIAADAAQGADEQLLGTAEPRHDGWLEPGQDLVWTGELRLPLDRLPPLRQGASVLFVPLVRITLGADGGRAHRIALVIGEPAADPAGRLAPIRLEAGPRVVARLAARPLDLPG